MWFWINYNQSNIQIKGPKNLGLLCPNLSPIKKYIKIKNNICVFLTILPKIKNRKKTDTKPKVWVNSFTDGGNIIQKGIHLYPQELKDSLNDSYPGRFLGTAENIEWIKFKSKFIYFQTKNVNKKTIP